MDNEKFTFTMEDLKPEVRAKFEEWLGFKVNDWEVINEIYRAEEELLNEALDILFDSFEGNEVQDSNTKGAKWVGDAISELSQFLGMEDSK